MAAAPRSLLVDATRADYQGTFITHSPPVAAALGRGARLWVMIWGGTLDARAMVCVGAQTIEA